MIASKYHTNTILYTDFIVRARHRQCVFVLYTRYKHSIRDQLVKKNSACTFLIFRTKKADRKVCFSHKYDHSSSFTRKIQTVFFYSFRTSYAYHLIRFSIYSYRSKSIVPKLYPKGLYHLASINQRSFPIIPELHLCS